MSDKYPDRIWLIEQGYETVWCDCAAPADDIDAADSVGYVRADVASDLLGALKELLEDISDNHGLSMNNNVGATTRRQMIKAVKAIKKAEGEG